jgi:hypothetical protein
MRVQTNQFLRVLLLTCDVYKSALFEFLAVVGHILRGDLVLRLVAALAVRRPSSFVESLAYVSVGKAFLRALLAQNLVQQKKNCIFVGLVKLLKHN